MKADRINGVAVGLPEEVACRHTGVETNGMPGRYTIRPPSLRPVPERQDALTLATQPQQEVPDTDLVMHARDGDMHAFRKLVERYEEDIAATVVAMLGPTGEVDDVVQEVFIRFYDALSKFRGESSVRTYLKRIAINRTLDVLRKRKRFFARFVSRDVEGYRFDEAGPDGGETIDRMERRALVHRAIQALPPRHREVVVLRLIEGYSTQETAELLGIAYGTVLSRLSRAQVRLKRLLTPYMDQGAPSSGKIHDES